MRARKVNRRTFLHIAGAASSAGILGGLAAQMGLDDSMLLGLSRTMLPIPRVIWKSQVPADRKALDFMTEDHHQVRDFVVIELPRVGKPLSPEFIAQALALPLAKVTDMLGDLEQHMTFLFRNEQGEVVWAYPVTAEATPHRVTFSSGEQIYAAWAVDAIATPFVQGQLRSEPLSCVIATECGHCHQPLHIEIDSELNYRVVENGARPLVYAPFMSEKEKATEPSITEFFWKKSIFFWSEEHAKEYRRQVGGETGTYMTMPQCIYVTRVVQSALFGF